MRRTRQVVFIPTLMAAGWLALALLPARAEEEGIKVYGQILRSTVLVLIGDGDGRIRGQGSGALIDANKRIVLTNYHVAGEARELYVLFPQHDAKNHLITERDHYINQLQQGRASKAKVLLKNSKVDLALIQLDAIPAKAPVLPLARDSASPGQKVYSVGNPGAALGGMWILTEGSVRQVTHSKFIASDKNGSGGFEVDARVVLTQSPTNPGDSGGPLVNSKGELIGVTQGGSSQGQQISIFIDQSEVKTLLAQAKIAPRIGRDRMEVAERMEPAADSKSGGEEKAAAGKTGEDKPAASRPTGAKVAETKLADNESKAQSKLKLVKGYIDEGQKAYAKMLLDEIVAKFPDTKAATEAKELLEKLKK